MGKGFNMVVDESGVGVITIDAAGDALNVWTEETCGDFDRLLRELEIAKGIRGVLFISGKPGHFLTGPDREPLSPAGGIPSDGCRDLLARMNALKIPTVAAIHGLCLGGGLAFSLACTARIAKEGEDTRIGYGAFEPTLKGATLAAADACRRGIVDRLVPPEGNLLEAARSFLAELIAGRRT